MILAGRSLTSLVKVKRPAFNIDKDQWRCSSMRRGVQKVRRPTQLTTRYAHHILSLFNIVSCNWNALGPEFLHRSDTVVEELLFLVFQPAICRAIRTRMANAVSDGVVQSRHFGWPVIRCVVLAPSDFCFFFRNWKNSWKDPKFSDDEDVICTACGWLEDQRQQLFYDGIRALEKCWTKCISVAGVYVEK